MSAHGMNSCKLFRSRRARTAASRAVPFCPDVLLWRIVTSRLRFSGPGEDPPSTRTACTARATTFVQVGVNPLNCGCVEPRHTPPSLTSRSKSARSLRADPICHSILAAGTLLGGREESSTASTRTCLFCGLRPQPCARATHKAESLSPRGACLDGNQRRRSRHCRPPTDSLAGTRRAHTLFTQTSAIRPSSDEPPCG